jgi:hypothetical protein
VDGRGSPHVVPADVLDGTDHLVVGVSDLFHGTPFLRPAPVWRHQGRQSPDLRARGITEGRGRVHSTTLCQGRS